MGCQGLWGAIWEIGENWWRGGRRGRCGRGLYKENARPCGRAREWQVYQRKRIKGLEPEQADQPGGQPGDDGDGDGGDEGAGEAFDLHALDEAAADHQDDGRDDERRDGSEQVGVESGDEETQQPPDHPRDDGDDGGGDEGAGEAIYSHAEVEAADDEDHEGGEKPGDDDAKNCSHDVPPTAYKRTMIKQQVEFARGRDGLADIRPYRDSTIITQNARDSYVFALTEQLPLLRPVVVLDAALFKLSSLVLLKNYRC